MVTFLAYTIFVSLLPYLWLFFFLTNLFLIFMIFFLITQGLTITIYVSLDLELCSRAWWARQFIYNLFLSFPLSHDPLGLNSSAISSSKHWTRSVSTTDNWVDSARIGLVSVNAALVTSYFYGHVMFRSYYTVIYLFFHSYMFSQLLWYWFKCLF